MRSAYLFSLKVNADGIHAAVSALLERYTSLVHALLSGSRPLPTPQGEKLEADHYSEEIQRAATAAAAFLDLVDANGGDSLFSAADSLLSS